MTYELRLTANDGTETTFGDAKLDDVEISARHTAPADWSLSVPYDLGLESLVFQKAEILYEGSLIFRGELELVESDEDRGRTRLSGSGVASDLKNGDAIVSYSNRLAHTAIGEYFSQRTGFDATVVEPTARTSVSDRVVKSPDSQSEWESASAGLASDVPLTVSSGALEPAQTAFVFEGESYGQNIASDNKYSGGEAARFQDVGDGRIQTSFNLDHTVPAGNGIIAYRYECPNGNHPEYEVRLDGTVLEKVSEDALAANDIKYLDTPSTPSDLDPGSHKLTFDAVDGTGDIRIDVIAFYDTRFTRNSFDNSVGPNGYLSNPTLFPSSIIDPVGGDGIQDLSKLGLGGSDTPWNIAEGTLTATMEQGSAPKRMRARLNEQTFRPTDGSEENTTTVSTDFGPDVGTKIEGLVDLGHTDASRTTATPKEGYEPQRMDALEVAYSGNDVAVIGEQTFEGDHLTNLQRLHDIAGMRFSVEYLTDAKPVTSFRPGDTSEGGDLSDETVKNRTRRVDVTGYANEVTVRGGRRDNGSRPRRTVRDEEEIAAVDGAQHADVRDPSLETQADVDAVARKELGLRIDKRNARGTVVIVPSALRPGFEYTITWSDGATTTVPLERVRYNESDGSAVGRLRFDLSDELADLLSEGRKRSRRVVETL